MRNRKVTTTRVERRGTQLRAIRELMIAETARGIWSTLNEIAEQTGFAPASISAQLRHLRKECHGGYCVQKRPRLDVQPELTAGGVVCQGAVWEYRVFSSEREARCAAEPVDGARASAESDARSAACQKRVIDFDAMWASDKLASCADWAQAEYAWFYGLADASGSFELTNLRVIWGRVAAVRRNLTLERLTEIFEEFMKRGLLFTWEQNGKRYGHWTGSDVPGRLPPPSWRMRLERLAPTVPREKLAEYMARYSARVVVSTIAPNAESPAPASAPLQESSREASVQRELNLGIESPQAQEWDLNVEWKGRGEVMQECPGVSSQHLSPQTNSSANDESDEMFAIYEEERGSLPPAESSSQEIRRLCRRRMSAGLTLENFRQAVRRAAATPFLAGAGGRGWCATFDWFVANDDNIRKVLSGRYEPPSQGPEPWRQGGWGTRARSAAPFEARAGTGPVASAAGARVKAAALARIRAREESRANDKEKAS